MFTPTRKLFLIVLPVACFLSTASKAGSHGGFHLVNQYPIPGSQFNTRETGIAFKLDRQAGDEVLGSVPLISLFGEKSGSHTYSTVIADDGRTVVIHPDQAFVSDEAVDVSFNRPLTASDGTTLRPSPFTFYTGSQAKYDGILKPFEGEISESEIPESKTPPNPTSPFLASNDTLPIDFPYVKTIISDSTSIAPGRLFLTNLTFGAPPVPYLMILENSGAPIFYRKMPKICTDFKEQPNGLLTYFQTQTNKFFVMDTSYTVIDSLATGNGYTADVHELRLLPNGHALLLAYDSEYVDMSTIVPGGQTRAKVIGLIIQELDSAKNVTFQWRSWDHFQITDATHENLTAAQIDAVHGNALEVDTDGNLLLSSRHLDEITKIGRDSGNVIWRLGGKNNQFTFANDTITFSHQHAIRKLTNGHITLFDNGNFHTPTSFSRAVEYALDESTKTATLVWQFRHSPSVYGQAMGYVQRFDNGNTLIAWGASSTPAITEVDANNSVVFELNFFPGVYSYRSFRFPWKQDAGETQPSVPKTFTLYQNYPNPFNPKTRVLISLRQDATVTFQIYDYLGKLIKTYIEGERKNAGDYFVDFDGSNYASGWYYYRLTTEKGSQTKAMQLVK